jgi:hypothetical protein
MDTRPDGQGHTLKSVLSVRSVCLSGADVEPQRISFNVRAHNGVLHRDPIARTGKNGGQFVTAQLRYRVGQETAWASVIVFAEDARTELLRVDFVDLVAE